jgi:hypothetical protein
MDFQPTADDYDGTAAFPDRGRPPGTVQGRVQVPASRRALLAAGRDRIR